MRVRTGSKERVTEAATLFSSRMRLEYVSLAVTPKTLPLPTSKQGGTYVITLWPKPPALTARVVKFPDE